MTGKPASKSDYENIFERAFDGHIDPAPLLNGIGSKEAALRAHRAAHEYGGTIPEKERIADLLRRYEE